MMNQAKKANRSKLYEEVLEEIETDVVEEVQVEEEMTSRYQVLETNKFPHILGKIFSDLNPLQVKEAALVSR